jgi:chromosome segregation ATPase
MAVQLITSVLKAVFAAHDNRLEKQIERISERVEVLQEQFEKLEEAMDRAFSLDQVSRYSEEAKKNMESQIQGYQQMIALEEDKKKTDHEKIKEWEEAMEEVQEQYDELMEEGFNLVTSDILSDVMGAARDFVDAWHDAFMETGDGLSGLEQNFTDMFKELMRQQAAMSIVGPYVASFKDQLKQFVDFDRGDTTLTAEEAREWAEKVKNTFPEISALLQSFFEGTQDLMQEQGELSELSKGIQGVTESTAQVLEALLNSMRFYVADSNMRLQNIEAAFASEEVSRNPILNELRQQTQMIRSIESMFDSVIGRGGSVHAGAYLKVSM